MRCSKCFSLLYWTSRDGYFGIPYGTLIDEPTLKPMYHQFVGSKALWYEILDDLLSTTRVLPPIADPATPARPYSFWRRSGTLAQATFLIFVR